MDRYLLGIKTCGSLMMIFFFLKQVWMAPVRLEKLVAKLKKAKLALKTWNKNVFGLVDQNILELIDKLTCLGVRLQISGCVTVEQEFITTKKELKIWEKIEAMQVGQIAKKKCLKESEQNSKFFHAVISACWNKLPLQQ